MHNNRKYNFGAGPATLPTSVLEEVKEELLDWKGRGLSVLEISHRTDEYQEIALEAEQDFRDLLSIPSTYAVLFTHGGATLQNSAVPLNLTSPDGEVSYVNSGHWADLSIQEAKKYTNVKIAASSEEDNFSFFPPQSTWELSDKQDYIHLTPNETIGGIALRKVDKEEIPIVADFSSSILSEYIDIESFGLLYGGAQKNIGPAGLGFVIVNKELLGSAQEITPSPMNYLKLDQSSSMYNTPPTFSWYVAGKVFKWLKGKGGVKAIGQVNEKKAKKLYEFIDKSDFYSNKIEEPSRSIMNIPFLLEKKELNSKFLTDSSNNGLLALKGHRSVGGMRASIYNAMPEEGVDALIEFMKLFEKDNL